MLLTLAGKSKAFDRKVRQGKAAKLAKKFKLSDYP
jgi:hypothetical protein